MHKVFTLIFLLLISQYATANTMQTTSVSVHYVDAALLVQALKPLLKNEESLSVFNGQILLHATPDTIQQMRVLIQKIDKPEAMLRVHIHQDTADWLQEAYHNGTTYSTNKSSAQQDDQSITVLSGSSAYISVGENYPIVQSVGFGAFDGASVSYQQKQSNKGFYIKPVLQGDHISLFIQREYGAQNRTQEQKSMDSTMETTVMIPLNQWIPLSSHAGAPDDAQSNNINTFQAGNSAENKGSLYIKIEKSGYTP